MQKKLTAGQIKRLEMIGMVWDGILDRWERNYQAAINYYREHGDLKVPTKYVSADGLNLGVWIQSTRRSYRNGMLWNTSSESGKPGQMGSEGST